MGSLMKSLRVLALAVGAAAICACAASVSTIVTGKERPEIDSGQVKVYSSPPKKYEDIAIISGSGGSGGTARRQTTNVIVELREAAAKLGANGILIEFAGTQNAGAVVIPSGNTSIVTPITTQAITAKAIYVIEE
jgi:hypothetical protein